MKPARRLYIAIIVHDVFCATSAEIYLGIGNDRYLFFNRPRSIYQYSNMAPRLSGQTSKFGVVFFVSKSLLGIEGKKKHEKFAILKRKPGTHARILIYRTWPISK